MTEAAIQNHAAFIWPVADLLRGDHKQSEYGKVTSGCRARCFGRPVVCQRRPDDGRAPHNVPQAVHFVDSLPRAATGKPRQFPLRTANWTPEPPLATGTEVAIR